MRNPKVSNAVREALLVGRVVLGDNRAFDELVILNQGALRRFFLNLTAGDAALADDLAQETFIRAFLAVKSFRGGARFGTWLFAIGLNVFNDHAKKRTFEPLPSHLALSERDSCHIDLYRALGTLNVRERAVVDLFYFQGMPLARIAKVTDSPVNTVKTLLSRGRKKIERFLEQ